MAEFSCRKGRIVMDKSNRDGGIGFIGFSTSIFDKYASAEDLRVEIMQFENYDAEAKVGNKIMKYPENEYVHFIDDNAVTQYERIGSTMDEYGSTFQLSLSLEGKYKLFSGEIGSVYKCSEKTSRSTQFHSTDYLQKSGVFQFAPLDYEDLFKNEAKYGVSLNSKFKSDLEGALEPQSFFKRYGTHWIRQIVLGGRANLTYFSNTYSGTTETDLSVYSTQAYNALAFSISSKQNTEWEEINKKEYKNTSHKFSAKGGRPEYIVADPAKWRESVNEYPSVVSFGDSSEEVMVPLWAFLEEGSRKAEFEKAYETLCIEHHLCPEPLGEVEVYSYPNYSGLEVKFPLGNYDNLESTPMKSNNVDSVKVPDGLVVTAWSHPNYKQVRFGPFRGPIQIPSVYGTNDWDSMKVEYTDDVEPFVEIFAYPNFDYSKKCTTLEAGNYPNLHDLNVNDWNNEIDSIIIPKGLKVTAWSHPNYEEKCYGPYYGPQKIPLVEGQNDWDSIKIERI